MDIAQIQGDVVFKVAPVNNSAKKLFGPLLKTGGRICYRSKFFLRVLNQSAKYLAALRGICTINAA